jgi:hypothetical protein
MRRVVGNTDRCARRVKAVARAAYSPKDGETDVRGKGRPGMAASAAPAPPSEPAERGPSDWNGRQPSFLRRFRAYIRRMGIGFVVYRARYTYAGWPT